MGAFLKLLLDIIVNPRYYISLVSFKIMPRTEYIPVTTTFDWNVFRRVLKVRHVLWALFSVAMTFVVANLLYQIPLFQHSLIGLYISALEGTVSAFSGREVTLDFTWYISVVVLIVVVGRKRYPSPLPHFIWLMGSGIPKWAIIEEMIWRYRSETRTAWQILLSAISFGFVHFANVIYPIAVCLAIIPGGVLYTLIYLSAYNKTRSPMIAAYESSVVHAMHNVFAFAILFIYLGYIIVQGIAIVF